MANTDDADKTKSKYKMTSYKELRPAFFVFAHRALAAADIRFRAAAESLRPGLRLAACVLPLRLRRFRPSFIGLPLRASMAASIRSRSCFNALTIFDVSIGADYS
jgi:hypothetical protein